MWFTVVMGSNNSVLNVCFSFFVFRFFVFSLFIVVCLYGSSTQTSLKAFVPLLKRLIHAGREWWALVTFVNR